MTTVIGTEGQGATAPDPGVPGAVGTAAAERSPKPRGARKEAPIAFRPRPGTRARLAKRAGGRSISHEVELAVDAWLGRKVAEVDPVLRDHLAAELSAIGDRLAEVAHQEAGVARNYNQMQHFLNTYRELPVGLREEVSKIVVQREQILTQLRFIRQELAVLVEAR
ncbi:hypothetical protein Gbro_0562 [Gordonia bronchialis DSM 43247]|uniref:Uncharacterized protein n=1 Tax=Gordonia bronchialis (strain ATCC 25592 / DSM 43247 / BCRC 13721 / JCM 3198 / KCTC 3076 / NBRC 16047 / NCTC 10667) TaxID=526226 RepID=D0LEH4_GORB4|nr:hypothetical protein [Gordonia bronchialis]ACY19892.1 hypothetical protein Gbro_0562 [Gordonia bronchialis DSM 43247]MCC3322664.1 hypothetical protein [Gordonia bronchialis]QGS26241.1 hypothetical protein FOB84_21025 [Gordonia bronchialis]STQ62669.1 Uncharacterised protein [Gordonia bronchialis]